MAEVGRRARGPRQGELDSLDGCWTNESGEAVTIEGEQLTWEEGAVARLVRLGPGEFAFEGLGEFRCKRDTAGRLVWSDGDVWVRRRQALSAPEELALAGQATPEHLRREAAALASRQRVAAAGSRWHSVLDVPPSATVDEVKRAFHELALLHHPDKGLGSGDASTFRAVQHAYEEGLHEIEVLAEAARSRGASSAVAVPSTETGLQVLVNAPKRELRYAMDRWETALDEGKADHIPDDISSTPLDEVVQLLLDGNCVPVDVRQPEEKYGNMAQPLPGAVQLAYMALLKSPETVIQQVAALQRRTDSGRDGRRIVCYSTHGGTSGNCSGVCCALMDVFGFEAEALSTLEDGYMGWLRWRGKNQAQLGRMPTPA